MTTRGQTTETRLAAMVRRLNIDIRHSFDLNMPVLAHAAAICGRCPHKRRCRDWLDRGPRGGYRTFCPNVIWFDLLPRRPAVRHDDWSGRHPDPRDNRIDRSA